MKLGASFCFLFFSRRNDAKAVVDYSFFCTFLLFNGKLQVLALGVFDGYYWVLLFLTEFHWIWQRRCLPWRVVKKNIYTDVKFARSFFF